MIEQCVEAGGTEEMCREAVDQAQVRAPTFEVGVGWGIWATIILAAAFTYFLYEYARRSKPAAAQQGFYGPQPQRW